MADDVRLRAVVELAQRMTAARGLRAVAHAAADGARATLHGSFAALSVWERDRGRLRVLVNVGDLAPGEEPYPAAESYPVHDFPEVTGLTEGPAPAAPGSPRPASGPAKTMAPRPRGGGPRPGTEAGESADTSSWTLEAWRATAGGEGPRAAVLRRRGRAACVVAPVVLHGRIWGELYVARPAGAAPFTADEENYAALLASAVATGLLQQERLEEVRRLAYTDPLTGLANRRAMAARLDDALAEHLASGAVLSLVVCDINGLKGVNDSYGHVAGDHLLERFGSVLSLCGAQLPGALAARLGGDEFCLIALGPSTEEVERCAEEICRRALELELGRGVACGVASTGLPIGEVRSARRLFRLADAAQYRAKASGSRLPVVAGRSGPDDAVVRLADTASSPGDRRGPPRRSRHTEPSPCPGRAADRRVFRGRTPRDE